MDGTRRLQTEGIGSCLPVATAKQGAARMLDRLQAFDVSRSAWSFARLPRYCLYQVLALAKS